MMMWIMIELICVLKKCWANSKLSLFQSWSSYSVLRSHDLSLRVNIESQKSQYDDDAMCLWLNQYAFYFRNLKSLLSLSHLDKISLIKKIRFKKTKTKTWRNLWDCVSNSYDVQFLNFFCVAIQPTFVRRDVEIITTRSIAKKIERKKAVWKKKELLWRKTWDDVCEHRARRLI